jgi:FkbM family methyltransferase
MTTTERLTEGPLQRLKAYLRQFPKLVYTKRSVSFLLRNLHLFPLRAASRLPVFKSRMVRKIMFDIGPPERLLISTGRSETFVISAGDKSIAREMYGNGEPYDFDKMLNALSILGNSRPKTLMIDVGANIGTICIPAVKRGLFQRAIAIEPEPRNYSLLLANIHINGLGDKIVTHNLALGQRDDEQALLEIAELNLGDHRIHVTSDLNLYGEAHRKTIKVQSESFDKIVSSIEPKGTLIWMDTQGFEGYILSGAKKALQFRPPICLEFWPYGMTRSKSYAALKAALIESGYGSFYNLNENLSSVPLNDQSFDELYVALDRKRAYTELLILGTN